MGRVAGAVLTVPAGDGAPRQIKRAVTLA